MDDYKPVKDWLHLGKRVSHKNSNDRFRQHGTIIDVHPYGYFIVQWDEIKTPERVTRNDLV